MGGGAAAVPAPEPDAILGASLLQWVRSDVVTVTDAVDVWPDQSGAGLDYTGSLTARFSYSATGGPNNLPYLESDGTNDVMSSSLNLPAPATTPTLIFGCIYQVSWASGDSLCGGTASNDFRIFQLTATPGLGMNNNASVNLNNGAPIGGWKWFLAYFTDTTSDYLTLGSSTVTGGDAGGSGSTGRQLGAQAGANFIAARYAEIGYADRDLTAGELTQMQTYAAARYGASVLA
jgi:hypothetical protein